MSSKYTISALLALLAAVVGKTAPLQNDAIEPTFQTGVERVLVPVIVRDSSGLSVGNLQRENFRLFDEGKLQLITDFSVERQKLDRESGHGALAAGGDTTSSSVPIRFLAYVFDDRHISFPDLEQARRAFEAHLREGLTLGTRAAVITTTGSVVTPFTVDSQILIDAASRIKPGSATHIGLACPEISYYMADLIINRRDPLALSAAYRRLVRCGPPVPRALGESIVKAEAARILRVEHEQTKASLKALEVVVNRLATARARREIVLLSSGFNMISERPQFERILNHAVASRIVVSAVNAHGVHGDLVDASDQNPSDRFVAEALRSRADTLSGMAEVTGGRYMGNTNDLRQALRRVAEEPEHVYLLAFGPAQNEALGKFRELRVEVSGPRNVSVQARRGYYIPQPLMTRDLHEIARSAMMSVLDTNEIPLQVEASFQRGDQTAFLRVIARIRATGVPFRPCGQHQCNALTLAYGLFDADGNYVREITRRADLRLDPTALKKFQQQGIQLSVDIEVLPGPYSVRVVALEAETRKIAAVTKAVTQN